MPLPKSVMKINKKGMQFTSSVDLINYTIKELNRAALRDVARMLKYKMRQKFNKLPGMRKQTKRFKGSFQHWLRKRDGDLQIGIRHNTWYGVDAEMGSSNQPKRGILRDTVMESISDIREIESKYLSAISGDDPSSLIDESEEVE